MTRDDLAALEPVADALETLGVEYYIGGSMASSVHGVARATLDIDVVAALIGWSAAWREPTTWMPRRFARRSIAGERSIDVFVMRSRPFDDAARGRTARHPIAGEGGRPFPIASPEDTILNKLEWYRAGDEVSERQWNDLVGVMKVQREDLDRKYLEQWAGWLGVSDLLGRAWSEAGAGG